MKKLFLMAAIAVFGFTSSLNAQNVSFGVKAGVNFANLAGDFGYNDGYYDGYSRDTKAKVGFHIGGLAEIMLSEKFALQPELLFSSQGYKTEYYDDNDNKQDNNVTLSYITLPIMAKFYPIENLAIEMGPQVGLLISANDEEVEYYNDLYPEDDQIESKDLYKGVDFALNFGASYKMDSGLFFSARYNLGLAKVDDEDYYDDGIDDDFGLFSFSRKNRVIQLSVGYMF